MKEFKLFILSCFAIICVALFGSVFTSCSNDDDLLLASGSQTEKVISLSVDSVKGMTKDVRTSPLSSIPTGWSTQTSSTGVMLLKKNNYQHYVVVANLSQGAKFGMVFDHPVSGEYTQNATFTKKTLSTWNTYGSFFACVNSIYFGDANNNHPTTDVPFAFKQPFMYSYGTGGSTSDQGKSKAALLVDDSGCYAEVINLGTTPNYYDNYLVPWDKMYVGFVSSTGNSTGITTNRTFVGIKDQDGDGKCETILVLACTSMYHSTACNLLINDFGCSASNIVTFDGGASTQLICNSVSKISSSRIIPAAFVIKAGN